MALLSEGKRKKYFKELGYSDYNKATIIKFQKKYFIRTSDIDGIYGKDTDTLLRHVINVKDRCRNFTPEEFKCECGGRYCTGYPTRMRAITLTLAQTIRDKYGKPMNITSGLRCKTLNAKVGGVSNSKHLGGKAFDYYIKGVTDTLEERKKHIQAIKSMKNHDYSYGNGYDSFGNKRSAPSMGNAVHTQSK